MSFALAFVLHNWRWFAGAGLAGIVIGLAWAHVRHDHKTQAALDHARADNALWAQAYRDEKRAVGLQNASISRMASDARAWEQRAQDATAAAHRANVKAQQSAAAFLAIKPKGATVCERAEDVADMIRSDVR